MKIQNFDALAKTDLRRMGLTIAEAGLEAIDTKQAIRASVGIAGDDLSIVGEKISLGSVRRIFVAAVGKCAVDGAEALEEILGERLSGGVVIDVKPAKGFKHLTSYVGSHPLPSDENVKATTELIELLKDAKEDDLVIALISGGGSTLLCSPQDMGHEEEAKIFGALTSQGATIQEINTVRKHLSLARGGYLAKYAYPARVVSLIFSDVPGNDLQFIASGPTVKDTTTEADAQAILAKYNALAVCGIERCGLLETPKDDKYFDHVRNILIVSNDVALKAMAGKAEELGLTPETCATCLTGEARDIGRGIAEHLHDAPAKTVRLYGGETTVTIRGGGKGGRNMECALAGLSTIREGELFMTIASDGRDNSDFAGGICDIMTGENAERLGLDGAAYLARNDAYPFFEKAGDYLLTGPTGSNVSDLMIAIKI